MHKFKPDDIVMLKLKERGPMEIRILERVEGKPFYRLDWGSCGFNKILNTVAISESALNGQKQSLEKAVLSG
jgi:hypothetical protein